MSKTESPSSMDEIWRDAIKEFKLLTGTNLQEKSGTSFETVSEILTKREDGKVADKGKERKAEVKKAAMRILTCVQFLGGTISQAASLAFPATGVCYGALSLLLELPMKLKEFHDALDDIILQVDPVLKQLRMYQEMEKGAEIHPVMLQMISDLMISFVRLCGKFYKYRTAKTLHALRLKLDKVVLGESEVLAELETFKRLVENQKTFEATLAYQGIVDISAGVSKNREEILRNGAVGDEIKDYMSAGQKERRWFQAINANLENIRHVLSISENDVSNMVGICDKFWNEATRGSVEWLSENENYQKWARPGHIDTSPVLLLTGVSGSGKSIAASVICRSFDKRTDSQTQESDAMPVGNSRRILVAYYAFPPGGKKDADDTPAETAFKYMCVQLAQQDSSYAKELAADLYSNKNREDPEGEFRSASMRMKNANCKTLWNDLKLGSPTKTGTHILVLDGIDHLSPDKLEVLIQIFEGIRKMEGPKERGKIRDGVRVLMCGGSQTVEALRTAPGEELRFPSIDVGSCNQDDIRKFIKKELKSATGFKIGVKDQKLKDQIQNKLVHRAAGSFTQVADDIKIVKRHFEGGRPEAELMSELMSALSEDKKDPNIVVREAIASLEGQPNNRRIVEEANEILLWVDFGPYYYSVDEIDTIFEFRSKAPASKPLRYNLQGAYSKLVIDKMGRVLLQDCVQEHIRSSDQDTPDDLNERTINLTVTIKNAKPPEIQCFFWDLARFSVTDQFRFLPTDISAVGPALGQVKKAKVGIDETKSHLEMLETVFSILLSPPNKTSRLVGPKLFGGLTTHLGVLLKATEKNLLGPEEKQTIVNSLVEVFHNPEHLERHWESTELLSWTQEEEEMDHVWGWLTDYVATRKLDAEKAKWLNEVTKSWNPIRKLLTPLMTMLARRWLKDKEWQPLRPCATIVSALIMTSGDKRTSADRANVDENDQMIIKRDQLDEQRPYLIEKAWKWCEYALQDEGEDAVWHLRLGETYAECHQREPAKTEFKTAEAILRKEMAVENEVSKDLLFDVLLRLGSVSSGIEQFDYYDQAYQMDQENDLARYRILKWFVSQCSTGRGVAVIHRMQRKWEGLLEKPALRKFLGYLVDDYKNSIDDYEDDSEVSIFTVFNAFISAAGRTSKSLRDLLDTMQEMIKEAGKKEFYEDQAILKLHRGIALYICGGDVNPSQPQVGHWQGCWNIAEKSKYDVGQDSDALELLVGKGSDTRNVLPILSMLSGNILSKYYFDQIRLREKDGSSKFVEEQVKKIEKIATDQISNSISGLTNAKCYLASQYSLRGFPDRAKALLKDNIEICFNLLSDGTVSNDWIGYSKLAQILTHVDDYENSGIAYRLIPYPHLNEEILAELLDLESEEAAAAAVTHEVKEFYTSHCKEFKDVADQVGVLLGQIMSLSEQAPAEQATHWKRTERIIRGFCARIEAGWRIQCDGCDAICGFEDQYWACYFCRYTHFCEECHARLSASQDNEFHADEEKPTDGKDMPLEDEGVSHAWPKLICSPEHKWFSLPVWSPRRFAWACRGQLPGLENDGELTFPPEGEAVPVRKWLGFLCDKWGLSKDSWGFDCESDSSSEW